MIYCGTGVLLLDKCCFLVVLKTSQGSASFSVLGNRSVKHEISPPGGERQVKSCCKKVPVIYNHTVPGFCFSEKMTYLTLALVSDNTQTTQCGQQGGDDAPQTPEQSQQSHLHTFPQWAV